MKKILLILIITASFQFSNSQQDSKDKSQKNIETTVIELDLASPHENSVKNKSNKKRLVVPNKNPLAFKLINGNPFRYKYVLNYKKINLFTNEQFKLPNQEIFTDNKETDSTKGNFEHMHLPKIDTDASIMSDQKDLKEYISRFKSEIEDYISEISNELKLDVDVYNANKKMYKDALIFYKKRLNKIDTRISNIESENSEIEDNQNELKSLISDIEPLIKKLYTTRTSSFLLPIDTNGENIDYIEVQLDIYDGDIEEPETYTYKVWINGGLKIDVSGGVYITSLFDNEYYTTATNDPMSTERLIYESNSGNYDFGFGTMINVSLRGGSWVRPTLNFGALFTSNQKFQMLSGLGLILGKNERLIVHGGLSMGRVNVLRENYQTDGVTAYDLGADGTVPVDEKFKFGHFFGITYNFSKPKSNKDAKK